MLHKLSDMQRNRQSVQVKEAIPDDQNGQNEEICLTKIVFAIISTVRLKIGFANFDRNENRIENFCLTSLMQNIGNDLIRGITGSF